ncbi:MAG: C39 family peptidase, partial [Planctomycetota bacterium]|nr:C39 family peptidase [Planctomycetota bacterium]
MALCAVTTVGLGAGSGLQSAAAAPAAAATPIEAESSVVGVDLAGEWFAHDLVVHDTLEEFAGGTFGPHARVERRQFQRSDQSRYSVGPAFVSLRPPTGVESVYESPAVRAERAFTEALLSWNMDLPQGATAIIELRVGRGSGGREQWSPWLYVGRVAGRATPSLDEVLPRQPETNGEAERRDRAASGESIVGGLGNVVTSFEGGKIDTDYFVAADGQVFESIQYRVRAGGSFNATPELRESRQDVAPESAELEAGSSGLEPGASSTLDVPALVVPALLEPSPAVFVDRVAVTLTRPSAEPPRQPEVLVGRRLSVPFRSQRTAKPEIAGRICSPTSLAMLLAFRGERDDVADAAACAYDPENDIFGNWPANVQAAYELGVPAMLTRFANWGDVADAFARGQPIIASIRVRRGELAGAPYDATSGHLIVLKGFDGYGSVFVNDPAA